MSGWIKEVKTRKITDKYLICGQVSSWHIFYIINLLSSMPLFTHADFCRFTIHKDAMNRHYLAGLSWNGEICCVHCNFMAGLGETCTQIASYLESCASLYEGKT